MGVLNVYKENEEAFFQSKSKQDSSVGKQLAWFDLLVYSV